MRGRILLHVCCAPDATTAIERLSEYFNVVGFFGNSNIQPLEEYDKRKEAVSILAAHYHVDVVYGDYDPNRWKKEMKGLEGLKEGGARCRKCIYLNLMETALKARSIDIKFFTTSLMTSPHKAVDWIEKAGNAIAAVTKVHYHHEVFRKRDGFLNSVKKSKAMGLYRQNYCGCDYSIYSKDGDQLSANL